MKKILKYGSIIFLIFLPLASVGGYYMAVNSEAFIATKSAIYKFEEVCAIVGKINDIDLKFFGYFIRFQGPKGSASFRVNVTGTKDSVDVYIDLKTDAGQWGVKILRVDR